MFKTLGGGGGDGGGEPHRFILKAFQPREMWGGGGDTNCLQASTPVELHGVLN